jgi:hypothetical protein
MPRKATISKNGNYEVKTLVGENSVTVRSPEIDKDQTLSTNQFVGETTSAPAMVLSQPTFQYESDETTSAPAMVLRAHQVGRLMEFLIPRTEASIIMQLTTPGCRLQAVMASVSLLSASLPKSQLHELGAMT